MLTKLLEAMGLNTQKAHLRRWREVAGRIGALESGLRAISDEALRARAAVHRKNLAVGPKIQPGGRDPGLEESFALVREASRRLLGMRHFDVQLVGAMALYEGKLAEMKTGEGKSLCLTLAAIHNALSGDQTHVVTVNEYLARRDAEAMVPLYEMFGLEVGLLAEGQDLEARRAQYAKDIVYGVNHEFGFDYLRHNMAKSPMERRMVRGLAFAIVDEVDSILIDEARTPLIISGAEDDDLSIYAHCWEAAQTIDLVKEEAKVDERQRGVTVSDGGFERMEDFFIACGLLQSGHHLYEPANGAILRALQACLQARFLYHRDQHYIVAEGKVLIVDENTGRLMSDRRWANGLHQAMEAKEGVEVLQESKTLATITYQNFFGLYAKLSGLTGTAMTQSGEFHHIYGLEAVAIPTHRPMVRIDRPDVVFKTHREKFQALAAEARKAVESGRPVLAGTSNIEESEKLSEELERLGVAHQLLNAKNHALEAQIIEQAGFAGRVTVATNMAGRGTDIVLGGNWGAKERALREVGADAAAIEAERVEWRSQREKIAAAGGLLVLGCARNDSRRVDNQLRGRSGRQGDPGESRFLISLEDTLFRVYAQNGMLSMIDKYGMMPEGSSLEHPMLNRSLERAQAAVEGHHFDMRKQLQDFDGVGASQRRIVYRWRDEIIDGDETLAWSTAKAMVEEALDDVAQALSGEGFVEAWEGEQAKQALSSIGELPEDFDAWVEKAQEGGEIRNKVLAHWMGQLEAARGLGRGGEAMAKGLILDRIDNAWQEHLTALQGLMDGIHLRSYAQKDPKQEYKREGYEMFSCLRGGVVGSSAAALLAWARWAIESDAQDALVAELAAASAEEAGEEGEEAGPMFPQPGAAGEHTAHWLDLAGQADGSRWGDALVSEPGRLAAVEFKRDQQKSQNAEMQEPGEPKVVAAA